MRSLGFNNIFYALRKMDAQIQHLKCIHGGDDVSRWEHWRDENLYTELQNRKHQLLNPGVREIDAQIFELKRKYNGADVSGWDNYRDENRFYELQNRKDELLNPAEHHRQKQKYSSFCKSLGMSSAETHKMTRAQFSTGEVRKATVAKSTVLVRTPQRAREHRASASSPRVATASGDSPGPSSDDPDLPLVQQTQQSNQAGPTQEIPSAQTGHFHSRDRERSPVMKPIKTVPEPTQDMLMTERETCSYLHMSRSTLNRRRLAGDIPWVNFGRGQRCVIRFRKRDLDMYIESCRKNPLEVRNA